MPPMESCRCDFTWKPTQAGMNQVSPPNLPRRTQGAGAKPWIEILIASASMAPGSSRCITQAAMPTTRRMGSLAASSSATMPLRL